MNGLATNGAPYSARILNLAAYNLEWDANRRLIYASVLSASPVRPNSVISLDPVAETIVAAHSVAGGAPERMRMTSDRSKLYVGVPGTRRVERLSLPNLTPDIVLDLGMSRLDGSSPLDAMDFAPMPGSSGTVAVVAAIPQTFPPVGHIAVFDDAVERPAVVSSTVILGIDWSSDATKLYGNEVGTTGQNLYRLSVDAGGVNVIDAARFGLHEPAGFIDVVDGRIHSNIGEVLEESTLDRAGTYPTPFPCLFAKPEPGASIVYALCGSDDDPAGSLIVYTFERESYRPIATATISNLQLNVDGFLTSLIRWGTDGLAFTVPGNKVVLLNGEFVQSITPASETPPPPVLLLNNGVSRAGSQFAVREIRLRANDIVSDPSRDVLYLSLGLASGFEPNTVALLDAESGSFVGAATVGSDPNRLAVTGDSQFLYVGLDGASSIRRFRLDDFSSDAVMRLGRNPNVGPYFARQILVAPDLPRTIAVARSIFLDIVTTPADGVAVFDDDIRRPNIGGRVGSDEPISFPNGPFVTYFQWGSDATTIYGANADTSAIDFSIFSVDNDGLNIQQSTPHAVSFNLPFEFSGGLLLGAQGQGIQPDPVSLVSQVDFGIGASLGHHMVLEDPAHDRFIYFAVSGGAEDPTFWISLVPRGATTPQDVISFAPQPEPPPTTQTPLGMATWGQDGVAIQLATGRLLLIDGPALAGS